MTNATFYMMTIFVSTIGCHNIQHIHLTLLNTTLDANCPVKIGLRSKLLCLLAPAGVFVQAGRHHFTPKNLPSSRELCARNVFSTSPWLRKESAQLKSVIGLLYRPLNLMSSTFLPTSCNTDQVFIKFPTINL